VRDVSAQHPFWNSRSITAIIKFPWSVWRTIKVKGGYTRFCQHAIAAISHQRPRAARWIMWHDIFRFRYSYAESSLRWRSINAELTAVRTARSMNNAGPRRLTALIFSLERYECRLAFFDGLIIIHANRLSGSPKTYFYHRKSWKSHPMAFRHFGEPFSIPNSAKLQCLQRASIICRYKNVNALLSPLYYLCCLL